MFLVVNLYTIALPVNGQCSQAAPVQACPLETKTSIKKRRYERDLYALGRLSLHGSLHSEGYAGISLPCPYA